jgi:hypothetical protein
MGAALFRFREAREHLTEGRNSIARPWRWKPRRVRRARRLSAQPLGVKDFAHLFNNFRLPRKARPTAYEFRRCKLRPVARCACHRSSSRKS